MIHLIDIMNIENPEDYKLHIGTRAEGGEPLDWYVKHGLEGWVDWNRTRGKRNDWNRDYIFSLIKFYPLDHAWLFGGVFKVLAREDEYKISEVEKYSKFTGRLILSFDNKGLRGRAFKLEKFIHSLQVNQILESRYTGEVFPGYEKINHDFHKLRVIFSIEKPDWKVALSSISGVYLIYDKKNGKGYIGSAYGEGGIWGRWAEYLKDGHWRIGHGNNAQLVELLREKGIEYAEENFRFTLLETSGLSFSNIVERETYWKEKLGTRDHGYNSN